MRNNKLQSSRLLWKYGGGRGVSDQTARNGVSGSHRYHLGRIMRARTLTPFSFSPSTQTLFVLDRSQI